LRYLLLGDIHSNCEALEACLELAQGRYERVICLGDLVGYGPDPNQVIDRVRGLTDTVIRGNHDKACAGLTDAEDFNPWARMASEWTRQQLTPEHFEFLRSLPAGPLCMNGFQVVHGAPDDEDDYILGATQALPILRQLTTQIVLFGHTHCQGGFLLTPQGRYHSIRIPSAARVPRLVLPLEDGGRYLINPGSVGQPRDGDWHAAFAILDEEKQQVEYYRTAYEVSKTQKKMEQAGLPEALIRRLELGR